MNVSDFGFDLPAELIAQAPAPERGASRLLVLRQEYRHRWSTRTCPAWRSFFREGDLLVVNDTKVFPARLLGARVPSGGAVECLLLAQPRRSEMGCARASGAEAAAWRGDGLPRHAARAARRNSRSSLPRPAHDTALVGERRERRGRDRRHRPHAAAAVYQARRHDGRSRPVSDRLCARARFCRGADGGTSFHA